MTQPQNAPPSVEENQLENENEVALQIPPDSEFVRVVRLCVMGVASRMAFSYDSIEDIKLAVSEACNNAILHSMTSQISSQNTAQNRPPIVIRLVPFDDRLEISVEDGGRIPSPGLSIHRARKPALFEPDDEIPEGGMGLFLIQSLMDEVRHESGANSNTVIYMTKFLPAETPKTITNTSSVAAKTGHSSS